MAAIVTDVVRGELRFCGKYELIEKARMQEVLRLQGFQQTGCTEAECAAKLGKILNVKKMVVGGLGKMGESYRLSLRVVDVETAVIETEGAEKQALKEDDLDRLVPVLVSRLFCPEIKRPEITPPPALPESAKGKPVYKEITNPKDRSVMIEVPAGEFIMGSNTDQGDEAPRHKVSLDTFYIGKYEVTVQQYLLFCVATGRTMPEQPEWNNKNELPVVGVKWEDAKAYCDWAGLRLPTEAEWEKAARGTDGRKYPWGDEEWNAGGIYRMNFGSSLKGGRPLIEDGGGWKEDGYEHTAPVGSFPEGASPYGALDMAGNVLEWCNDWFDGKYYASSPHSNPRGPASGKYHILRGSAWSRNDCFGSMLQFSPNTAPLYQITNRFYRQDIWGYQHVVGFRVAK
jgi:formylglycine-generating enzyme required for sulfatase activity